MSAFGPKRTSASAPHMSAFGGKADISSCTAYVRFRGQADVTICIAKCPLLFSNDIRPVPCMGEYVSFFHKFISTSVKHFAVSAATASCTAQSLEASNNGGENT